MCVLALLYFIETIIIFILLNQGILGFRAKVLHVHQLQKWNKKKSTGTRSRVQRRLRTAVLHAMGTRTGARATHSGAAPSPAACRPHRSWPAPVSSGTGLLGLWGRSGGRRGLCWLAWPPRGHSQPTPPPCPSSLWRLRCGGAVQCGPRPWARNGGGEAMPASVMRTSLKSRAKLSWPALPWVRGLRCFRVSSCATLLCQSPSGGRETLAAGSAGWGVPALSLQRTLNLVQWQRVRGGCSQRLTVMQT